ncbi:MAG: hypothetical protein K2N06_02200 [Oscillospiraceae bacterium]|nr:hypothetical protein [Oscillospiraceae bacterium]
MGAEISFTNHIHISDKTHEIGPLKFIGFNDLTSEMLNQITEDKRIKWVQIDEELPEAAYRAIDGILERRPDLYFRVFGIDGNNRFDLSVLGLMPHLTKVWIDAHLRADKDAVNIEYLRELPNLTGLHLDLFDRRDYGFLDGISPNLEELILNTNAMSSSVKFDCEQLLRFKNLRSLWLGKKAKKHLERISELPQLKSLSLCGIKVDNFDFLKGIGLEKFALLWCGNSDLSGLAGLETLKELELWRIMKLENIDFVSSLTNLEVLKLRDLKHITMLPNTDGLMKLRMIVLDNVPIDIDFLGERERALVAI